MIIDRFLHIGERFRFFCTVDCHAATMVFAAGYQISSADGFVQHFVSLELVLSVQVTRLVFEVSSVWPVKPILLDAVISYHQL